MFNFTKKNVGMCIEKINLEFNTGMNEVELTPSLISSIVAQRLWNNEKALTAIASSGGKWNTVTQSVVFPI